MLAPPCEAEEEQPQAVWSWTVLISETLLPRGKGTEVARAACASKAAVPEVEAVSEVAPEMRELDPTDTHLVLRGVLASQRREKHGETERKLC